MSGESTSSDTDEDGEEDTDEQNGEVHADQPGNGERRPRRRGRRGGRRRRGGEVSAADEGLVGAISDDLEPASPSEALAAVADLDAAPSMQRQHESVQTAPPPQPVQEPAPDESDKSPRRRSTVREKVSFLFDAPSDTAAPAINVEAGSHEPQHDKPTDSTDDDNAPRRAGWWSKRE